MRYIVDNDLHIHSYISRCSKDPSQTSERILRYAKENGLKTICLTDHFWDDSVPGANDWYKTQNYEHIAAANPLPQEEGIRFLFGCETEMDKYFHIGISKKMFDKFAFIVIPTTHLHMTGFTIPTEMTSPQEKAQYWLDRFNALLNMDLPFHKIGIPHLTCGLMDESRKAFLQIFESLKTEDLQKVFSKAAQKSVGIELNASSMNFEDSEAEILLRPYQIAKEVGCKFYMASDAHCDEDLKEAKAIFEKSVDMLELTEDDKFILE